MVIKTKFLASFLAIYFNYFFAEWIKNGQVPQFDIFTNEPKAKKDRRHKKYAREFKEADEIKEKMKKESGSNDLAQAIMHQQLDRESAFDKLIEKYSKVAENKGKGKNKKSSDKKKETPIKSGRVSKSKK